MQLYRAIFQVLGLIFFCITMQNTDTDSSISESNRPNKNAGLLSKFIKIAPRPHSPSDSPLQPLLPLLNISSPSSSGAWNTVGSPSDENWTPVLRCIPETPRQSHRCRYCELEFTQRTNLNRHIRRRCPVLKYDKIETELMSARVENAVLQSSLHAEHLDQLAAQNEAQLARSRDAYAKTKLETKKVALAIVRQRQHLSKIPRPTSVPRKTPLYHYGTSERTRDRHRKAQYDQAVQKFGDHKTAIQVLYDSCAKHCKLKEVKDIDLQSKNSFRFARKLASSMLHAQRNRLQVSEANFKRTVASVYGGGSIMARAKFRCLQKLSADLEKDEECEIPYVRFFPYERMEVRTKTETDIENKLKDVSSIFPDPETVKGKFREVDEVLPCLAEMLLKQVPYSEIEWLGDTDTFHVCFGADGWPENREPAVDFSISLLEF